MKMQPLKRLEISIRRVPDVPKYGFDDEQISWKSSSDEDDDAESENDNDNDDANNQDDDGQEYDEHDDEKQGDDDMQTDSDNDGDDFVYPKFSTHDEENKEEDSFDPRVQTLPMLNLPMMKTVMKKFKMQMMLTPTIVNTTQVIEYPHVIINSGQIQKVNKQQFFCFIYASFQLAHPSPDTGSVEEQVNDKSPRILPKIEKTVNEQLEAEALTRPSNESKTSYAVAANLSELELKKILIDKMESNKRRDEDDKMKNPLRDQTEGPREESKKEPESNQCTNRKRHPRQWSQLKGPNLITSLLTSTFKPAKPLTLDRDWNKTLPDAHGSVQPWLSSLAQMESPAESAHDVYSKRRIIAVTKLEIVEWHNYKHLDWITVHKDDDKLHKLKKQF
ncbi:hypothetical protein Tco_0930240 [Tanacetum coccineum]